MSQVRASHREPRSEAQRFDPNGDWMRAPVGYDATKGDRLDARPLPFATVQAAFSQSASPSGAKARAQPRSKAQELALRKAQLARRNARR